MSVLIPLAGGSLSARRCADILQDGIHRLKRGFWIQYDVVDGTVGFGVVAVGREGEAEQAGVADAGGHFYIFERIAKQQQVMATGELRNIDVVFVQAVDKRRLVSHRNTVRVKDQRVRDDDGIGGG